MSVTPDQIANAAFSLVRKGFDPDEVRAFQHSVAQALDSALEYASLMEQRAKAAAARLNQLDQSGTGSTVTHGADHTPGQPAVTSSTVVIRADDAQAISRTMVLAQRAADQAIEEARAAAASLVADAEADVARMRSDAEIESARLLAEARNEAQRAGEAERVKVAAEIQALLARLDFLREDVRAMQSHADVQRQRLVESAEALRMVAEARLGQVSEAPAPVLSPSAEMPRQREVPQAVISAAAAPSAVIAPDAVKVAAAESSSPGAGVTTTAPLTLSFSEDPTGPIPAVRPSSGPVSVPDVDDWDEPPSVRIRVVRPDGHDSAENAH
jgi:DivIVA domain-containing protein